MHEVINRKVRGLSGKKVMTEELDTDGNLVYEDPALQLPGTQKMREALVADCMKALAMNIPQVASAPYDGLRAYQLHVVLDEAKEDDALQIPDKLYQWLMDMVTRKIYINPEGGVIPKPANTEGVPFIEWASLLYANEYYSIVRAMKDADGQASDLEMGE